MRKPNEFEEIILWIVAVILALLLNGYLYYYFDAWSMQSKNLDSGTVFRLMIMATLITASMLVAITLICGFVYCIIIEPMTRIYRKSYPKKKKVKKQVITPLKNKVKDYKKSLS